MKDDRVYGDDFYDRWHEAGDEAFGILQDGCEYPPSLEVFEHSLEVARRRSKLAIPVVNHARLISDTYQRAPDFT